MKNAAPLLLILALAGCGGGGKSAATTEQAANGDCKAATPHTSARRLPDEHLKLDPEKTYRLVFQTNCGDFTITLDQKTAPNAAGSLVSLAKRGFFDDTFFHRIVPGFVIQGGDPTGKGTDGFGANETAGGVVGAADGAGAGQRFVKDDAQGELV